VFVGECYEDRRLAEWFGAADLTVIPHRSGLSVVQSLAFGTPVLTGDDPESEMPEWEAIEPAVTGAFYRDGDVGDLARAIECWVATHQDREQLREVCKRGVVARHFNPEFQVNVIEAALSGRISVDSNMVLSDSSLVPHLRSMATRG
jgi:glycosyltransferase involved in cell wall biosynthesis